MVNIKKFDTSLLEINKLSFRGVSVNIYYIKYITMKILGYVNIDNEDFLYLIFDNVNGNIEEKNGIKYLVFAHTDENKEALKKYAKLWNETKNQIKTINGSEPIQYSKDFINRFESDDDLPLGKTLNIPNMIIVATPGFEKDTKYYPQVYLH